MKSLAVVLAAGLAVGGCSNRTKNLYIRYSGIVAGVAGGGLVAGYYLNGEYKDQPGDPKGFDVRPVGIGLFVAAAAVIVGTYVVKTHGEPLDAAALKQREITLQADKLLHDAEAAASKDDCATVTTLAPQIDKLDPGVGAVLRSNVAAARCLAAPAAAPEAPAAEPPA